MKEAQELIRIAYELLSIAQSLQEKDDNQKNLLKCKHQQTKMLQCLLSKKLQLKQMVLVYTDCVCYAKAVSFPALKQGRNT